MFLSGDDNFEISGVPVKSGVLELSTNMAAYWLDVPVDWTDTRHKPRLGNIGFADGSARETYWVIACETRFTKPVSPPTASRFRNLCFI
jgi:prepilin-type processing-associated H-X9-DG protein